MCIRDRDKGDEICRAMKESGFSEKIQAACSAGIVIWNEEASLSEIISRADQALYRAKAENKGGCFLWKE